MHSLNQWAQNCMKTGSLVKTNYDITDKWKTQTKYVTAPKFLYKIMNFETEYKAVVVISKF